MPLAPKSMQEVEQLGLVSDPASIREQLQRLLVHPLFANSKRYPALLAYTVEQTLLGNAVELKERSIGIEVFGRAPTYDANADPVVRITAGEVRKRLSLYYYDSSHTGELVIELPLGSYVPVFRQTEPVAAEPTVDALETAVISTPPQANPFATAVPNTPAPAKPSRFRGLIAGALLIAGCVAGVFIGVRIHPLAPPDPPSNIDLFWEPFTSSFVGKPGAGRRRYLDAHGSGARGTPQSLPRGARF
jgi:hypothetical protein